MEDLWINPLILMKLLLMVLPFKLLYLIKMKVNNWINCYYWMLPHCLWVLRLLVVWWLNWLRRIPPFLLRRNKPSPLIKTINQEFWFKFMKGKDQWLRIIICWVNSLWMESHLPQEEFLRLKWLLIWMPMVFWMFQPLISNLVINSKLLLQMIREDCLMKKSRDWLRRLKNSKLLMSWSWRLFRLRILLSNTFIKSRIQSLMKNWKTNSLKKRRRNVWMLFRLLNNS